ncbi:MAG: hypothetical protein AB9834_08255 [Lentimicrobium sp.]
MRTFSLKCAIAGLAILLSLISMAQKSQELNDSLPILKPKKSGHHFLIHHASIREVSFKFQSPVKYPFPGGRLLSDSANYTGPSFGIGYLGLYTARARTFLLRGELDCDNPGLDWTIALFSEGLLEKVRSSEKQEDGSYALNTEKTIILYWDKGSGGMIVEQADTIGRFYISMKPSVNEHLIQYNDIVYSERKSPVKSTSGNEWYLESITKPISDFGIYGKIRERKFALLSNGKSYQSYIFIDDKLKTFFQSDIDFQPMLKKQDRIQPYIRFDNTTDVVLQNDLFRLAILSRYLMEVLNCSSY